MQIGKLVRAWGWGVLCAWAAAVAAGPGQMAAKAETGPFTGIVPAPSASEPRGAPPLLGGLGDFTWPITTTSPLAQQYFDQGLKLGFAFNHGEARRAFRYAQELDPGCAMCFWGEALVLGPNINAPMAEEAAAPALAAITTAVELAGNARSKEQALIRALTARYGEDPKAERANLDAAYAEAMGEVAARFPDDDLIAVLHAESLMDLSPWDYWEEGGTRAKGQTVEILSALERVLQRNPRFAAAIHLYIHAVEASDRPERAEPHAERLAALMPAAGHLVHMPAHIYYRVGRYADSLETNRKAVAADETYFARVGGRPAFYGGTYYPHNVHFLMISAQMAGDGPTAVEAAQKLDGILSMEQVRTVPWVQPIKAAPYLTHAQFSPPETILALPDPGDEFPFVKAHWHYARGIGYAFQGDYERAEAQAVAIERLARADFKTLAEGGIPAAEVLEIAARGVRSRIARQRGDIPAALAQVEAAAAVQDRLPYMEPPYWYFPVRQSLGALRLVSGDDRGAEEAFQQSLKAAPNNGWVLYGLVELYERRGDADRAREVHKQFKDAWLGDPKGPGLERL